jgi:hypothetical protein
MATRTGDPEEPAQPSEPVPDGARQVGSVAEEYAELRRSRCECGGSYTVVLQRLVYSADGRPADILSTKCSACGSARDFVFDISSFFGKW